MNRWLIQSLLATGFVLGTNASAQPAQQPESVQLLDGADTLQQELNRHRQMTVPVTIGSAGTFRFSVDTAAERTVVSRELAASLGLQSAGDVRVATMADIHDVPSVTVPRIDMGARTIENVQAPTLAEYHLGADGILGVDGLENQRVTFDFDAMTTSIVPSRIERQRWPDGAIVVEGRTRLGRLVLADATVGGQRVWAIVDTGSPISVGNIALLDRILRRPLNRRARTIEITDVTGAKLDVQYTTGNQLRLSEAQVDNLPMAFADLPVFDELGLDDRPTVLLGMDVLQLFRRVEVDFTSRRMRLLPKADSFVDRPAELASLQQ